LKTRRSTCPLLVVAEHVVRVGEVVHLPLLFQFFYFSVHAPSNFWPLLNGGELAALYFFLFLYLAAAGPGPWSLDTARVGTQAVPR
jgi:uncharacterized membrane protein YphA (DoxX/SURF4 family)